MTHLRSLSLRVLASALFAAVSVATLAHAQRIAPDVRITGPIDTNQRVLLKGNVLPVANSANDRGAVSASLPMQDLVLVLSRSPEKQAAFDAYVEGEYDASSPNFHQWLTAEEIGNRFGPSATDIATISNWLAGQGFTVSHVSKDGMAITFSGTAGQVQSAFRTSIHNLSVSGVAHIANMTNPQIPAALAPVVVGIKQLHDFHPHPLHRVGSIVEFNPELGQWQKKTAPSTASAAINPLTTSAAKSTDTTTPHPLFYSTSNGFVEQDVSPNDFATIYNVQPLWTAGTTGTNQTIAIVGTSDIVLSDVSSYKSSFGLPAGNAPIIKAGANGIDPGVCTSTSSSAACGIGDLEENTLDVEVSGAVAPGAQVVLVTSGYNNSTNPTNDPILQSAQYIEENINTSGSPVYGAHQMSVSYGLCELFNGTSGNVTYYNLWQSAAAEGLAVFVASGDSGSPACDQGFDGSGNPYSAQGGLMVSGLASTPFNTAVGGTDFSWCQPTINSSGNSLGCGSSNSSPYWNNSNASNNSSSKGYVPEIPWNDSCENPIWAKYIQSVAAFLQSKGGIQNTSGSTPEQACNYIQTKWYTIYQAGYPVLASFVDTVGGGGGHSNCVVNNTDTASQNQALTCTSNATSVSNGSGSTALSGDGWPVPPWQTGVTGTSGLTSRAIPDVSLFSGNGTLNSATLICLAAASGGSCSSSVVQNALEIGGTSVASPEMAGVMALINQKNGKQGLPNKPFYQLAASQNYASCSAESVTTSSSCYFQSIDEGSNAMPCNLGGNEGGITLGSNGWTITSTYLGDASPNCTALTSGDTIGTLVSSGTTPAYNATAGFNMATGLGSLNVKNVVDSTTAWVTVGSTASTVTVTPASTSISPNQSLQVTITVAGASGTPTGTVTLSGGGYTSAATTLTSGSATITIPGGSFSGSGNPFTVTLTANYSGDTTYAQASGTSAVITVTKLTPTAVTVTPAASTTNSNVPLNVTVTVAGTGGTPTGTVTLSGGGYNSGAQTLSSGSHAFTIPANTFTTSGPVTLAATYSGDGTYVSDSGSAIVTVTYIQVVLPSVTLTPSSSTINSSQGGTITVSVTGTNGVAAGTISLSGGGYSSTAETIGTAPCTSATTCVFTIPANSFTSFGSVTITAHYSGDADYLPNSGTTTITVNQSVYALSATTPAAITAGGSATSTVTGQTSSTGYTGTVTLKTCTLQSSSVTNPVDSPTCSASGTITYAAGTATGTGTATVSTTNTAMLENMPGGKGWLRAGGGAVLALLVFLGIPARRRSWRALLGMAILMAVAGGLSACGGGINNSGGGGGSKTSAGTYTFTVSGQGNDPASTTESTTFTVTVN